MIKSHYGHWKVVDPEIKLIKMGKKRPRKIPHILVDDGYERKLMNLNHLSRGHSTMSQTRYWEENKNKFSHPDYQKFRDLLLYKDYIEVAKSGRSSELNGKRGPTKVIEYKGVIHPLADFCREYCGWAHKTSIYKHYASGANGEQLIKFAEGLKLNPSSRGVEFNGQKYSMNKLIETFNLKITRFELSKRIKKGEKLENIIKEIQESK